MTPKGIVFGLAPFALLVLLLIYITGPGSQSINAGTPLPQITLERIDFVDGEIRVSVRNTGPIPTQVVQADVNDRIQPAAIEPDGSLERFEAATVRIPYPWNAAEPYTIGVTIQDGTRFQRSVEAAAPAIPMDAERIGLLALAGTYIGVIPVFLGLMWLPFIRRLKPEWMDFFLALTLGLLVFLGVDSVRESLKVSSDDMAESMNGAMLALVAGVGAFLTLQCVGKRLEVSGAALPISLGIGLHNFGEGLALGAALGLGSMAFSAYLMVGFAIHNTTEGIAIAAPLARRRCVGYVLAGCGMVAGAPAIAGTLAGGFAYSPMLSVVFLAVGAGAIFQVVWSLATYMRDRGVLLGAPRIVGGMAAGTIIMYGTSILV